MMKNIVFILVFLCVSCTSESEKILETKLSEQFFNFENIQHKNQNIVYNFLDNIQYGIITLKDGKKVKFWFLSHHLTSDKGGTIYEFPNGEKIFYSGMHCCEVQFYQPESLVNLKTFKKYLDNNNGIAP